MSLTRNNPVTHKPMTPRDAMELEHLLWRMVRTTALSLIMKRLADNEKQLSICDELVASNGECTALTLCYSPEIRPNDLQPFFYYSCGAGSKITFGFRNVHDRIFEVQLWLTQLFSEYVGTLINSNSEPPALLPPEADYLFTIAAPDLYIGTAKRKYSYLLTYDWLELNASTLD